MTNAHEKERIKGDEELLSPATTPGSVFDEEKCLVTYSVKPIAKKKCTFYLRQYVPVAMLATSILEVMLHIVSSKQLRKVLLFEPNKQQEIWRFMTYMIVHDDWFHLFLNVIMQCLFAIFLERRQGSLRVMAVYLFAGITGVLGASCVHPDLVIGASAGVYSLLTSNLSDLIINLETVSYKMYRILCIGIIVLSDVVYNVIHSYSKDEPLISWGAHLVGGIAGFLLGLILFKAHHKIAKVKRRNILFWLGLTLYAALLISLVILTFQIKRCTPSSMIRIRYIYVC